MNADVYAKEREQSSALSCLNREQERRFRAMAWRHIRRINPRIARQIWMRHRVKQQLREAA